MLRFMFINLNYQHPLFYYSSFLNPRTLVRNELTVIYAIFNFARVKLRNIDDF